MLWAQARALLQQLKVAALLGGALRARPGRRLALVPLQLHVPRGAADGLDAGWASSAAM